MCVAGEQLFLAGPPDVVDERFACRNPFDPDVRTLLERQEDAYAGRLGGQLWVVNKADGRLTAAFRAGGVTWFMGSTPQ